MATPIAGLYNECAVEPVDRFLKKMMRIRYKKQCWIHKKIISKTLDEIMGYASDLMQECNQTYMDIVIMECRNQKVIQKLVQEYEEKKNEKER